MAAWYFAAHLLLLRLLLVPLIRSPDFQVRFQQPFVGLGQQHRGLDDLGVAHPQPFIRQVRGQLSDPYLVGMMKIDVYGLTPFRRGAGLVLLLMAGTQATALPVSTSARACTRRIRFTTTAFHNRPDRGYNPSLSRAHKRSVHLVMPAG